MPASGRAGVGWAGPRRWHHRQTSALLANSRHGASQESATVEWREAMIAKPMTPVALVTAAFVVAALNSATAQVYPSRPITMVVPFAAGGPTDVVGRIIAERLRASLGQTIIIENITGAAGSIGVGRVARSAPDGYTLSIGQWTTHVVNGAIYTLQYDLLKDFDCHSKTAAAICSR